MSRLIFLLFLFACDRPNFVHLVPVGGAAGPDSGPAGFSCRKPCPCSDGSVCSCLLFARAADEARQTLNPGFSGVHAMGSAVVDLMSIGPGPSDNDPFVVVARCTSMQPCVPILRRCFPLDLTAARDGVDRDGPAAKGTLLDDIFKQLQDSAALLTPDAPDDELLIRMVTTTLTCDQIAQRPLRFAEWHSQDPDVPWGHSIFGCGYAGPFHLDALHGDVFLGLPTLDALMCVPEAAVCAADLDPRAAPDLLGL